MLDEEIQACEAALQRNPRDAEALLRLSGLWLRKGDARNAAGCLVRAAHLYDEGGIAREAIVLLKQAARLEPHRPDVLEDLARHHLALGEKAEAVSVLARLADVRARGEDAAALLEVLARIRQLDPTWKPSLRV
jgi:tetratricopeptide (TPR) repeat protein